MSDPFSTRPRPGATGLPVPPLEAQEHSLRLVRAICDEMARQDGRLGFDRFMELALYAPGLGYYAAGTRKFGEGGDFVTAPEISPRCGCSSLYSASSARLAIRKPPATVGQAWPDILATSSKL